MSEDCRCESFQWTLFQSPPQTNLLLSREAQYVRTFCIPKGQKLKSSQTKLKIKFQFRAVLASFMKLHQKSCYPSFGKVEFSEKKHLRVGILRVVASGDGLSYQKPLPKLQSSQSPWPAFWNLEGEKQCSALSRVVLLFPVTALSLGDSRFAH